jgi:predicted glycosyltransferase
MSARLLIYNGLGQGLGHRERVLKIATAFATELPRAQVLLATAAGESLARRLPPGVEGLALGPGVLCAAADSSNSPPRATSWRCTRRGRV